MRSLGQSFITFNNPFSFSLWRKAETHYIYIFFTAISFLFRNILFPVPKRNMRVRAKLLPRKWICPICCSINKHPIQHDCSRHVYGLCVCVYQRKENLFFPFVLGTKSRISFLMQLNISHIFIVDLIAAFLQHCLALLDGLWVAPWQL